MKNLKITSLFNLLNKRVYLVITSLVVTIYAIVKSEYYLLLISFFLLFVLFKYNRKFFVLLSVIIVALLVNLFLRIVIYQYNDYGTVSGKGTIYEVIDYDTYQKIYFQFSHHKAYFISTLKKYKIGDVISFKGEMKKVSLNHVENGFNYYEYLKYQNIVGKLDYSSIEVTGYHFKINQIRYLIKNYLKKYYGGNTLGIISALVIGDKTFLDDSFTTSIQKIGIGHLFVISGLHIGIISGALFFLLKKLKIKEKISNVIVLIFLCCYYILTGFLISVARVIISLTISKFLIKYFKEYSSIDKLLFNASLVLLINPFSLFSYSFLLSYVVVFGILIISKFIKKEKGIKNYFFSAFIISLFSMLISLPIVSHLNYELNFLQCILNIIYIPLVSFVILPLAFIGFFLPFASKVITFLMERFIDLTTLSSKIKFLTFSFSPKSIYFYLLFYTLLFLIIFLKVKKFKILTLSFFIIYLIFWNNIYIINSSNTTFFDLPNGEATLLYDASSHKKVLIDTGDDNDELVNDLKIMGVKTIDLIIITHGDSDHIGGIERMINNFKVKKIGINAICDTSKSIISNLKISSKKIVLCKLNDTIKIGSIYLQVIGPIEDFGDINNNSLVVEATFKGLSILFLGDIEKTGEISLVPSVKGKHYNILKVAHHGSNTSSNINFLSSMQIDLGIAMNGYQNTFGFPSEETINNFKSLGIKLYNTINERTITFKYKAKHWVISLLKGA